MSWLHQNIHNKGSLFSTNEILTQATGKPLDANVYKAHLENRYLN
jgi:carboxypeptidase Taq